VAEQYELGEGLREALAARGCALTSAQARRLALALLDLVRADLLEPATDDAPSAMLHVYNMEPSNCREDSPEESSCK
jgi:hypothetical protein